MTVPNFQTFQSTVTPFVPQSIQSTMRMLLDSASGAPVGMQSTSSNGPNATWVPVDLTAAQIASPTQAMLDDLNSIFRLNEAPYTRYVSDGTQLLPATAGGAFMPIADLPANVLLYGADPTGVADSTSAFRAALATGRVVYAPKGTYQITDQIVVGAGQTLYGDGRGATVLTVGIGFSTSATGVISLTGRELQSPIVRDLQITFAQTSTQAVRANFRTLAAGGNLTTGIKYPPAIILTTANRFRILNVAVSGAWDGIVNLSGDTIGGYIIDNIEMGAVNCGLWLDNGFDFGHIKGYHFWNFGFSGSTFSDVFEDGQTFAAKFGVNGPLQALMIEDFSTFEGRVSIDDADTWIHFANLGLDAGHATLEINDCAWVQAVNVYTSAGASNSPQISMTGAGTVMINTLYGGGWINMAGSSVFSYMFLDNITPSAQQTTTPLIQQSSGNLLIRDSLFIAPSGLGSWTTVPLIKCTGGIISIVDCYFQPPPGGSTQPGISISTDDARHVVNGNFLNGWAWTPPGLLGFYGLNSDMISPKNAKFAGLRLEALDGGATGMSMVANAAQQRAMQIQSGNEFDPASVRWQWIFGTNTPETGANAGTDFLLYRYDDAGNTLGIPPLTITRSNGEFIVDRLKCFTFGLNIATPVARQTITGSRGGNAALASLLTALAAFGLITDSTSA